MPIGFAERYGCAAFFVDDSRRFIFCWWELRGIGSWAGVIGQARWMVHVVGRSRDS